MLVVGILSASYFSRDSYVSPCLYITVVWVYSWFTSCFALKFSSSCPCGFYFPLLLFYTTSASLSRSLALKLMLGGMAKNEYSCIFEVFGHPLDDNRITLILKNLHWTVTAPLSVTNFWASLLLVLRLSLRFLNLAAEPSPAVNRLLCYLGS